MNEIKLVLFSLFTHPILALSYFAAVLFWLVLIWCVVCCPILWAYDTWGRNIVRRLKTRVMQRLW